MYIHRVGRTARHHAAGKALMLLLPTEEEPFTKLLEVARACPLPLKRLKVNPRMRLSVSQKAAALNASRPEVKALATKAFSR